MDRGIFNAIRYQIHDALGLNHRFSFRRSYSQYGEDLLVFSLFRRMRIRSFSYLDIGCNHPYRFSNTALFYTMGMSGYCIDANPQLCEKFKKSRPRDQVFAQGIASISGVQSFYLMENSTLSTFSKSEFEGYAKEMYRLKEIVPVPVHTLKEFVDNQCHGLFPDFLSLDVEGLDMDIILSYDWSESIPKVICVETSPFEGGIYDPVDSEIINFLIERGYVFSAYTGLNSILVLKTCLY